ncbi:MAG: sugar phosphate isomerase/epimerase [Gemmatimonadetes bacterium]|nr:sugar phosphate isomerase/epimerase [Gemmatimonadota bacterium]NNL31388.1 sugar phosphate isomerase/epimerase [Gemmatimonadota bacterium]
MGRRSFLATLALGGSAVLAGCTPRRSEAAGSDSGWGVQLYTLRDRIENDLNGTLGAVAAIGYTEVELFQLHGLTPTAMRARLDAVGLRATSSHYPIQSFREGLAETVDGAAELGQSLMVLPSIPSDERTQEGLARVADDLSRAGERAQAAGLRVGYHNHDWELRPMADGVRPIDVLLDRSDDALVDWQMDVFWTVHGGADPLAMLEERGRRVTSVHVKDRTVEGRMVDVGDGVIDFSTVLAEGVSLGLRHAFVEHDQPGDSLESVRRSYLHLSSLDLEPA